MLRSVFFAVAALVLLKPVDAAAQDTTAPWTGFYAGINGGYAWSGDTNVSRLEFFPAPGFLNEPGFELEGAFGGGQIGYNFAIGSQVVLGIEADFQGGDIDDGYHLTDALNNDVVARSSLNWFGTVRARAGIVVNRTLVYATGGLTYGELESSYTFNNPLNKFGGDATQETGYVLGGGLETQIAPNWSLKAEYQHINLDADVRFDAALFPGQGFDIDNLKTQLDTVRVGVNYKFGADRNPAPLK